MKSAAVWWRFVHENLRSEAVLPVETGIVTPLAKTTSTCHMTATSQSGGAPRPNKATAPGSLRQDARVLGPVGGSSYQMALKSIELFASEIKPLVEKVLGPLEDF